MLSHTDDPHVICSQTWRANFARLAAAGLSFDLQVFAGQLRDAARLAADYPDVRIILDHAGMPIHRDAAALVQWRDDLALLARCENVTCKISALGTLDHRWSVASLRPLVEGVIEVFGSSRSMFASNFPVDGLYSSMPMLFDAFAELVVELTPSERDDLFRRTAWETYRLPGQIPTVERP
ncbi:amidohydrolase family protein [Luteimicrobium album]|uniref:amidohydrolase family protein n=1 Tax=Luteimicrobium album TaxID=1054550 RepID=UPI0024E1924F|nr:amidohydrolase family protein [Luteimicrobium album]